MASGLRALASGVWPGVWPGLCFGLGGTREAFSIRQHAYQNRGYSASLDKLKTMNTGLQVIIPMTTQESIHTFKGILMKHAL